MQEIYWNFFIRWGRKTCGYIWDKVFKSGPSKICGRQPLKNLLKAVFRKCYLVHSWILCPICFLLLVFFITEATKLSAITLVISNVFVNDNVHADQLSLTHFMPIVSFYNPLKKSENHMFPDVFRRYRKTWVVFIELLEVL